MRQASGQAKKGKSLKLRPSILVNLSRREVIPFSAVLDNISKEVGLLQPPFKEFWDSGRLKAQQNLKYSVICEPLESGYL